MDVTAILTAHQGNLISFYEARAVLRRAGMATLKDEQAKEENDSTMDYGAGVVGTGGFGGGDVPNEDPAE
jgi:hypothetical protein